MTSGRGEAFQRSQNRTVPSRSPSEVPSLLKAPCFMLEHEWLSYETELKGEKLQIC